MSFPNTPANIKLFIEGLPSFPVNRTTSVRYGFTDENTLPLVQVNECRISAGEWTTCGPAFWVSEYSVSCFANSNTAAITLASAVNDLLHQEQITANTTLNEFVNLQVVQEDKYKFHAMLTYRLQESA